MKTSSLAAATAIILSTSVIANARPDLVTTKAFVSCAFCPERNYDASQSLPADALNDIDSVHPMINGDLTCGGLVKVIPYLFVEEGSHTCSKVQSLQQYCCPTLTPCNGQCYKYNSETEELSISEPNSVVNGCDQEEFCVSSLDLLSTLSCTRILDEVSDDCAPSSRPSLSPTISKEPSNTPSYKPSTSTEPSPTPSAVPSFSPSNSPSLSPSLQPSNQPSYTPSSSSEPSLAPTKSSTPSLQPSLSPSGQPSQSSEPSTEPSDSPSISQEPSGLPSESPSESTEPSLTPSAVPSLSLKPTKAPTDEPTLPPITNAPTFPPIPKCFDFGDENGCCDLLPDCDTCVPVCFFSQAPPPGFDFAICSDCTIFCGSVEGPDFGSRNLRGAVDTKGSTKELKNLKAKFASLIEEAEDLSDLKAKLSNLLD